MRLTHFILRFCSKLPTNEKKLAFWHRVSESMISVAALTLVLMLSAPQAQPQDGELQKRVAEIKQYLSLNKIVLAQYRWQESQTVSVKGEVKKEELFQVQIGSDGQPQKTNLDPDESSGGRKHGIKHRIKEDYENYGKEIAALAQSYGQPEPGRVQQLFEQGTSCLDLPGPPTKSSW
jgi:hypothetical protein